MKFARPLDDLLGARSKVALLRILVRAGGEHTGRALAGLVRLDAKTCHTALQGLAREGVVESRRAGKAILYRLNDRHALVEQLLRPLFRGEGDFLADYVRDLRKRLKGPVVSILLFGSVARGEERPTSDVDFLIVMATPAFVEGAKDAVDRAAGDLATRYGSAPQGIVLDRASFQRKAKSGDPLVSEVLRTGRVVVGKSVPELLKHVS